MYKYVKYKSNRCSADIFSCSTCWLQDDAVQITCAKNLKNCAKYSQHGIIKSMKWTHSVSTDATVSIDMIVMWLHNSKMAELPVMWIYFNSVFYCFVWCIRIPSKKAYFSCSCSKQTNWATCCDMSRMSSPCRIVRLVTPTLFNCIHRIVVSSHLRWRCSYVMRRTWLRVS